MSFVGGPNGFLPRAGPSNPFGIHQGPSEAGPTMIGDPQFDIFEWHPAYQSCQRYFLDHAQHDGTVQAVAALVNITLPFQWSTSPVFSASTTPPHSTGPAAYPMPWAPRPVPSSSHLPRPGHPSSVINWVSLVPYIRRLVVTGFDTSGILHGFFGDDWRKGIGPLQECERRNYLFAAKSVGWAKVKFQYDMSPHEAVPFLKPLQNVKLEEIEGAEKTWSQWLAMEDWMVGPRAPETMDEAPAPSVED
ncbi:hypothetical protein M501DRAFT_990685 [Patellaria atrata CBS 101060]|uniref:Ilp is an apoptosis inhibitor n=1 Tax=Patellaria atrata CBS 101060 TaxID=1346257 RepID=A0A9P4SFA8_9PEZI|nr:hypothetical protein M501DRAFT_990685 [Patellaria atrata CBS 101060]